MPTLILDIETVGENFDEMNETTQAMLTGWVTRKTTGKKEQATQIASIKEELGLSPLTGRIVALGVLDYEKNKGTIYFDPGKNKHKETTEEQYTLKPMSEAEMLKSFWAGAAKYDTFITYNGRTFDIPYIAVRSAVHGVRPTKNLMSNRYLSMQRGAIHIDLKDQLNFYGAVDFRRHGSLHLWTRAFGIESPKGGGISGYDVGEYFAAGKILEIARYNSRDLTATAQLYERWQKYFNS